MTQNTPNNASHPQLDRADTRVRHDAGLSGALRGFLDQVRSGNLGMLPVVIGLVLISTVFSIGLLAKRNELTAMKATGISLYRIALPITIIGLIVSFISFELDNKR